MVKKWPVQQSANQPRSAATIFRFLSRFFPHIFCLTVHTCIKMVRYSIDILKHENSQSNWHEVAEYILSVSKKVTLLVKCVSVLMFFKHMLEEQQLVGIKNANALHIWNLDIATWCMNSFCISNLCH